LDGAIRVAEIYQHDPANLRRIAAMVEGLDSEFDMTQAYRGEAYIGIAATRNFHQMSSIHDPSMFEEDTLFPQLENPVRTGLPKGMRNRAYMVRHMQAHLRAQEELQKPGATLFSASEAV